MEIKQYFDLLDNHDWYYEYSDDHRVFKKGCESQKQIEATSEISNHHKKIFDDYRKYINGYLKNKPNPNDKRYLL